MQWKEEEEEEEEDNPKIQKSKIIQNPYTLHAFVSINKSCSTKVLYTGDECHLLQLQAIQLEAFGDAAS
jgi:hypothetical protein